MAVEFGTGKTVFVLALVAGCFAVLWPKLFYPMLLASFSSKPPIDTSQACCDVIFETDVNAIKIMTEMCGKILHRHDDVNPKLVEAFHEGKFSKEIVATCRNEVLEKCGVDIAAFLNEKVRLGHTYKQILDEVRSVNSSFCLKWNFGVAPSLLGTPRQMRVQVSKLPNHFRQERPPHMRPELMHPALREKGRAIPQSHIIPKLDARPPPVPGVRPPMGGPGHIVPPPKSSSISIIMPLYSIAIIIFFLYTIMKWGSRALSRKDASGSYSDFTPDPEFRKTVFSQSECMENGRTMRDHYASSWRAKEDYATKLGDCEIDQLRRRLEETEAAMERIVAQMGCVPRKLHSFPGSQLSHIQKEDEVPAQKVDVVSLKEETPVVKDDVATSVKDESTTCGLVNGFSDEPSNVEVPDDTATSVVKSSKVDEDAILHMVSDIVNSTEKLEESEGARVKVLGMETTASCEGGQKWSRPPTPVIGMSSRSRSSTPIPPMTPEPQAIFLEGALPFQSQLLVSESETQQVKGDDTDAPVILSGKMTLSLISLDAALAAEDEEHASATKEQKPSDSQVNSNFVNGLQSEKTENLALAENLVPDSSSKTFLQVESDPVFATTFDEQQKMRELESALKEDKTVAETQEVEEEEEDIEEEEEVEELDGEDVENQLPTTELVNDTGHSESGVTSTNYTTASAAAEATNATGSEETAADFSALQSIGPDDDQQDIEEELGDEEVWNGDVDSEEAESEEELENEELLPVVQNGGNVNHAEQQGAAAAPPCPNTQRQR